MKSISSIFHAKGWDVKDIVFANAFKNAYSVYENLSAIDRKIFLALLEHYEVITFDMYIGLIKKGLKNLFERCKSSYYYFIPIIDSMFYNDTRTVEWITHKGDSSSLVLYLEKSMEVMQYISSINNSVKINWFINMKFSKFVENVEKVKRKNGKIVICDDFSGSGDSILSTIKILIEDGNVNVSSIVILLLVSTKTSIENFRTLYPNIEVITIKYAHTINEIFPVEMLNDIKVMLEKLERKKKDKSIGIFGYNDTGCLISLIRTPNNTVKLFHSGDNSMFRRN